jgi:ParB family transcriptional regulator, chromosome partitioning protein
VTFETRRPGSGLGRGLAALIPQRENGRGSIDLPTAAIARNPYQPRSSVEQHALEQLAASVAEHGVLQPILVTETPTGYQLVAGERRLRAAEMAGLERIPALVRSVAEGEQLAFALIENLQREDLNAIEEARAFRQLMTEFGLTQDEVASRIGRSRSAVANTLRLLELAPAVQGAVEGGELTEGHGRALGGLQSPSQQIAAMAVVTARNLSVRQTEDLVRRLNGEGPRARLRPARDATELELLENGLREALGTKVNLHPRRKGGRITIEYYDEDDLGRIYERLTGGSR